MNSPEINPDARGVFFGVSAAHRKPHFIRAIMEAVAFALRDNLETLADSGVDCRDLTSLGGAARSEFWLQIKADVLQQPIRRMACEETTSLGAAILAAAGTGIHKNIEEAVSAMVRSGGVIQPDPGLRDVYETAFRRYQALNKKCFA